MRIEEADWRRITICLSGNRKSGMRDVSSCKTLFSLLLSENVYLFVGFDEIDSFDFLGKESYGFK